jgi:tRNA threonylcarbamoyladenosine dehydratase
LRRDHGFSREPGRVFGVPCLHLPAGQSVSPSVANPSAGLACSGYGSLVTVTATMGFAAAQMAIDTLVAPGKPARRA